MSISEAAQLSESVRQKVQEVKKLYAGMDEKTASSAPEGRWSPKEILSHLCGPEGTGHFRLVKIFLEQDNPRIDIDPGNSFFSERRSRMKIAELLSEFEQDLTKIADLAAGLTPEQLGRKAQIPALKESPMGENFTLGMWIKVLGERHVSSHIDHLQEILKALGETA